MWLLLGRPFGFRSQELGDGDPKASLPGGFKLEAAHFPAAKTVALKPKASKI